MKATSVDTINKWCLEQKESHRFEFKEAKTQYDTNKLMRYCVAIANEGGGKLVFGVTDSIPRKVVGTQAFKAVDKIAQSLHDKLEFLPDIEEVQHPDGRVLIFHIPARPKGTAYQLDGTFYMRAGESLVGMNQDRLRQIFSEGTPDWLQEVTKSGISPSDVVTLLDTQTYFELLDMPYPTNQERVIEVLIREDFVTSGTTGLSITRLGAILLAKRLDEFDVSVRRKAARLIVYEGKDKLSTRMDILGSKGYAVGFKGLIEYISAQLPQNEIIESAIRSKVQVYPEVMLRELIANALIHQDFSIAGRSVMIEVYSDRVEISNPGLPIVAVDRFIDGYQSRNERLADIMRRLNICEEKGSGVDRVIKTAEDFQLPPPDFRAGVNSTMVIVYAPIPFDDMDKYARIRACYQHACLQYVTNKEMNNTTLRHRFQLPESKKETVSRVLRETQEEGLIKLSDPSITSHKFKKYLPIWA